MRKLMLLLSAVFFVLVVVAAGDAFAQERAVSGTVTDAETGDPLPGANVAVEGASVGVSADANGEYEITNLPDDAERLIFSFVGYEEQIVDIEGRSVIDVALSPEVQALDDVVVIGYGERQRRDITGAVSDIQAEQIEVAGVESPEFALQGRIPGVFVGGGSGNPNTRADLQIRGVSTFGSATQPLIVIDGVPMTEFGAGAEGEHPRNQDLRGTMNIMNTINPNDIESISVLKDASAASVYGVRAANGVVLIETKSGREGSPTINLRASREAQMTTQRADVLNVDQYVDLYQEAYANNPDQADQMPSVFDPNSPDYLGDRPMTDWQDEIVNTGAPSEQYDINVSGGTEALTYYLSGSYSSTENPFVASDGHERYSFASNIRANVTDWIAAGVNYRYSFSEQTTTGRTPSLDVFTAPPWQPLYDENGLNGFAEVIGEDGHHWGPASHRNTLGEQSVNDSHRSVVRNLFTGFAEIEPVSNLTIQPRVNIDVYENERPSFADARIWRFSPTGEPPSDLEEGSVGSYGVRSSTNYNLTGELQANYNNSFGAHSIDVLANMSKQEYGVDGTVAQTGFIPNYEPSQRWIRENEEQTQSFQWVQEDGLVGLLGRVSYDFDNRYLVDVAVRRDGTSRFAPDYRWGTFPSVSGSWRISAESFMRQFDFIDDLRIKAGWGQLGNQETRRFAFLSTVGEEPGYGLGVSPDNPEGTPVQGARLPDFPVEDLSWETVTTTNVGFEGYFLNKFDVTAEWYQRHTDGILQAVNIAPSVGNEQDPIFNLAEVRNQGFEVELGYRDQVGPVQYTLSGNLTTVSNEVLSVFEGVPFGGQQNRIEEGYPMEYFWGYKVDKILRTQEEADAWNAEFEEPGSEKSPGDIVFQDLSGPEGEPDGVINEEDRTFLGSNIPGYYYGFDLGLMYGGFDLSIFFQGVGDIQKVNGVRWSGENMSSRGNNQLTSTLDRWTPDNQDASLPRAVFSDPGGNNQFSDRWVEDADYLRLRTLHLGYTIQPDLLEGVGLNPASSYRLFFRAHNLWTITGWSGIDPENDYNPSPRSFTVGIDFSIR